MRGKGAQGQKESHKLPDPRRPCLVRSAALKATCRATWQAFCAEPGAWHPSIPDCQPQQAASLLLFLRIRRPRLETVGSGAIHQLALCGGLDALEYVLAPCMAGEGTWIALCGRSGEKKHCATVCCRLQAC